MRRRSIFPPIMLLFVVVGHGPMSHGYDDKVVHRLLNDRAALQSNLDSVAREQMAFVEGVETKLQGLSIRDLLKRGGRLEDKGLRPLWHFHDPLVPWYDAGLFLFNATSSVVWAQDYETVPSDKDSNLFSWRWAREYYYRALTSGSEADFARTFRALGQVMHLVADAAVPAHVRSDVHLIKDRYEDWAKINSGSLNYTAAPVDPNLFTRAVSQYPQAPVPISALWDQDVYDGTNVTATWPIHSTSPATIGLAEFTNANFYTDDTLYMAYPHPNRDDTNFLHIDWSNPDPVDAEDGKLDSLIHIKNMRANPPFRLLTVSYITSDCVAIGYYEFPQCFIDDVVLNEYAGQLIPRAVGYSVALLNYFFRGRLEIGPPSQYVYSIIDGASAPLQFTAIKARIRNLTPDEEMINTQDQPGQLIAVARFRKRTDFVADLSNDPPAIQTREKNFTYARSAPIEIPSLPSRQPAEQFVFDFSGDPIPAGITDLYLHVVYKGKLGMEENAVATGMKDLCEPQHLVYWNNTDYFLLNGVLRRAEEIEHDPDVFSYGHIYPTPITEELGFAESYPNSSTPVVATFHELPPARYGRLVLLVDAKEAYWVKDRVTATHFLLPPGTYLDDLTWNYDFPNAAYQETANAQWQPTPVYTVRGVTQHQMTYFIRAYPYFIYRPNDFPPPHENTLGPFPATLNFP